MHYIHGSLYPSIPKSKATLWKGKGVTPVLLHPVFQHPNTLTPRTLTYSYHYSLLPNSQVLRHQILGHPSPLTHSILTLRTQHFKTLNMYSYSLHFSLSCDERQRFFTDMKRVTSTRERTDTLVRHQSSNSTTHDVSVYHYVAVVRVMVCQMSGLLVSQDQNTVLSERQLCLVFSLSVMCRPKCASFMLIVLLLSLSFSTHPSA